MRRGFIKAHRGGFGPIGKACEALRVSKSEYYDCLSRPKPNAQIGREALEGLVAEKFGLRKGRCGHRRINRELRRGGMAVSEKRVLAVMRGPGLQAKGTTGKHRRAKAVGKGGPRASLTTASSTRTPGTGSGSATSPVSAPARAGPAPRPRQARGIARPPGGRCRAGPRGSWP